MEDQVKGISARARRHLTKTQVRFSRRCLASARIAGNVNFETAIGWEQKVLTPIAAMNDCHSTTSKRLNYFR